MARKTKTVTIESGRDQGKSFLITEMPVTKADKWANTALCHMMRAGITINKDQAMLIADSLDPSKEEKIDEFGGMLELAKVIGRSLGGIDPEVLYDLRMELFWSCVKVVSSAGVVREVLDINEELEDPESLALLQKEALTLHIGFLTRGSSQT